mgnify:FL=1
MIELHSEENFSIITIDRPKVNPLDSEMIISLQEKFTEAEKSKNTNSIIITGKGSFFSFGLDIPNLLTKSRNDVKKSLMDLLKLCKMIYSSKKITISSINGHATGAGCMIAISTDYRYMVEGRAKIALNEINIGLPLFPSTINMLKSVVGETNAKKILLEGTLMDSKLALQLGLIDKTVDSHDLNDTVKDFAKTFANKKSEIVALMKKDLSSEQVLNFIDHNNDIEDFLDIFYSDETQEILKNIEIR